MKGATRQLLEGVIDYAGAFPPANLEIGEALQQYLRLLNGPSAWILNRLVCPSKSLRVLGEHLAANPPEEALGICVIGRPAHHRESWEAALELDVDDLNTFQQNYETHASIECYEIQLPDAEDIDSYYRDLRGFSSVEVYAELPWTDWMDEGLNGIAESEWLGAKVRTGGLTADRFPTARQLATFIRAGVSYEIPLKATAGLHQPLTHDDELTGAEAFGFINVLAAVTLAGTGDLSIRELELLLKSRNPAEWKFDERSLGWHDWTADLGQIDQGRELMLSFGSCSVSEPLDGLRELGW